MTWARNDSATIGRFSPQNDLLAWKKLGRKKYRTCNNYLWFS